MEGNPSIEMRTAGNIRLATTICNMTHPPKMSPPHRRAAYPCLIVETSELGWKTWMPGTIGERSDAVLRTAMAGHDD
jgi:hypothetical protein